MEEGLDRGRKRKRSESVEVEAPHFERSSVPPEQLSPRQREASADVPQTPPALPLTATNLRLHDPTMAPKPKDTASADTGVGQGDTVRANRQRLATWNTHIDDPGAKIRCQDFIEKARDTITGDRDSSMSSRTKDRVQASYNMNKRLNEITFLHKFLEVLVKDCRLFKPTGASEPVSRDWVSDHIAAVEDQIFRSDCIVPNSTCSKTEKLLRDNSPILRLPKPDYLWGLIADGWCSKDETATIKQYGRYTMASDELFLPWGLCEGKGLEGKPEEAFAQAARASAVCVASFRRLDEIAGSLHTEDGPDSRSHVFSLVLTTSSARISVHFAEIMNGKVAAYQMHELQTYDTGNSEDWPRLQRDIHNMIDWGLLGRLVTVKSLLNKLMDMGQKGIDKMVELDREDDAGRSSKRGKTESETTSSTSGQGK